MLYSVHPSPFKIQKKTIATGAFHIIGVCIYITYMYHRAITRCRSLI